MPDDDTDYIAMLERTQIPEDHPLIRFLVVDIKLADSVCQIDKEWPKEKTRVDGLIECLEERGLGFAVYRLCHYREAQIWSFGRIISKFSSDKAMPLAEMLAKAMYEVDWTKYPKIK